MSGVPSGVAERDLDGKTAVVTGGTRGIGRAISLGRPPRMIGINSVSGIRAAKKTVGKGPAPGFPTAWSSRIDIVRMPHGVPHASVRGDHGSSRA